MSKLVAISTGIENVTLSPGEIECSVLNMSFVNLCNKFGAEVVIVPPQNLSIEFSKSSFDRLILTGGGDINPETYGEQLTHYRKLSSLLPILFLNIEIMNLI